jgi:hypothetical protein
MSQMSPLERLDVVSRETESQDTNWALQAAAAAVGLAMALAFLAAAM